MSKMQRSYTPAEEWLVWLLRSGRRREWLRRRGSLSQIQSTVESEQGAHESRPAPQSPPAGDPPGFISWIHGKLGMNGEGPRPRHCRRCGSPLMSRVATGEFNPKTGHQDSWEQLYCPKSEAHWTWSYHWSSGWSEDWDV